MWVLIHKTDHKTCGSIDKTNIFAYYRYREKKRKEKEETRGVMEELEKKNAELKEKVRFVYLVYRNIWEIML